MHETSVTENQKQFQRSTHVLSEHQIAQYHSDGFLVVNDVFTMPEVEVWRDACESPSIAQRILLQRPSQSN